MKVNKKPIQHILLLLLSVTGALALCEGGLRMLSPNGYFLFQPQTIYRFTINEAYLAGVNGLTHVYINKAGYRGEPYDSKALYHILAIGGSTTECFYLNEIQTWPYLLEQNLEAELTENVWVGNLGKSGLNTEHHIAQLAHLPASIKHIDLVIFLTGVNDLLRELKYTPHYQVLTPSEILSTTFTESPSAEGFPYNLRLTGLLKGKRQFFYSHDTIDLDINGSHLQVFRNNRSNSQKSQIKKSPQIAEALQRYEVNLNRLADMCEEQNVPVLFLSQPTLWKPHMSPAEEKLLWLGANGDYTQKNQAYYTVGVLDTCMQAFNKKLQQTVRKRQAHYMDLEKNIPKNTRFFYDGMHFNVQGAKAVSQNLSLKVRQILENRKR